MLVGLVKRVEYIVRRHWYNDLQVSSTRDILLTKTNTSTVARFLLACDLLADHTTWSPKSMPAELPA